LEAWFADAQPDEATELITATIFHSGVYGTHETRLLSDAVKTSKSAGTAKQARRKKFWEAVLPTYKQMCNRYPVLKKAPVLLPFMWVVRWFTALFGGGQRIEKRRRDLQTISVDKIDSRQQALNFVGLDFNFKE